MYKHNHIYHYYIVKPVANKSRIQNILAFLNVVLTSISFHLFPKNKIVKKKLKTDIRMGNPISLAMKVCSHHYQASNYFANSKNILLYKPK